jgi:hypothetical protein
MKTRWDDLMDSDIDSDSLVGLETPLKVPCKYCHKIFYVELPSTLMGLRLRFSEGFVCSKCELTEH